MLALRTPTRLSAGALLVALCAVAKADAPAGVELRLSAPADLSAGDRAAITAELWIGGAGDGPVLLTPTAEGTAVEVVRGRLTRRDAEAIEAQDGRRGLRFAIPIAAHTPGTTVLRVHVQTFVCPERGSRRPEAATEGCRSVEAVQSLTVRVLRARG
jgi:hypothetical protein